MAGRHGETNFGKGMCRVFSLISRLFNHYRDHHFSVTLAGFPIFDGDGSKLGHVDRMSFGRSSVRVEGWCVAKKVALGPPRKAEWAKPAIKRPDVNASLDLPETTLTGFNLVWFGGTSGLVLSLRSKTTTLQIMCPVPPRNKMVKAELLIRASFVKSIFRASGPLARAYFEPTAINKSAAKRALRMRDTQIGHALDVQFLSPTKVVEKMEKITLIMPVFNAFDVLCEALERIVSNTDLPWRLILVEDCSTDVRVRPMLTSWVDRNRGNGAEIVFLANAENLGFIGSVNRALGVARRFQGHVVLLNSDVLVPPGWATRLMTPIAQNSRIASVTPLSNDAEIFTAPLICKRYDLQVDEADKIDAVLFKSASSRSYQRAPTGVGFCMAMNSKYLQKIPQFDAIFGKGYGEEVDWCQKVQHIGGKHVVQPNVFVEHRGGTSFGNTEKQNLIAGNNQIITKRYPSFDQSVQSFMATDPVRTARLLSACALLSVRQKSVDIYIAHSLGGGAEIYLREKIKARTRLGKGCIVLRLGGSMRWRIEAHMKDGMIFGDTDDDAFVQKILHPITNANFIYSCAVGDADPVNLPSTILQLAQPTDAKITVLFHDYFAISPSYCLLDSDGVFRPERLERNTDRAHLFKDKHGNITPIETWRAKWAVLLKASSDIICFSQNSADILALAFPYVQMNISIVPHPAPNVRLVKPGPSRRPNALGVLGDIGYQKGAKCLQDLSKNLPVNTFDHLTIVGRLDPRYSLSDRDMETGAYKRKDIAQLAEQHGITAWLIPSIWPETFSYTTHEALSTGLPVFCFDIGAQQEPVSRAPNGHVLPLELAHQPDLILSHISEVLEHDAVRRRFHTRVKKPWRRGTSARLKSAS